MHQVKNEDVTRIHADLPQGMEIELEVLRRMKALSHVKVNSTPKINFNGNPEVNHFHLPIGHSAAPVHWGHNASPPATPVSPTLNHMNQDREPYYARQ